MDRRDFLKLLGLSTAAVVAPKFIFDMGANLHKLKPVPIYQVPAGMTMEILYGGARRGGTSQGMRELMAELGRTEARMHTLIGEIRSVNILRG
jgi:hypothetical protein